MKVGFGSLIYLYSSLSVSNLHIYFWMQSFKYEVLVETSYSTTRTEKYYLSIYYESHPSSVQNHLKTPDTTVASPFRLTHKQSYQLLDYICLAEKYL